MILIHDEVWKDTVQACFNFAWKFWERLFFSMNIRPNKLIILQHEQCSSTHKKKGSNIAEEIVALAFGKLLTNKILSQYSFYDIIHFIRSIYNRIIIQNCISSRELVTIVKYRKDF